MVKYKKLLAITQWIIKPLVSLRFWFQALFVFACVIFNVIMFEYLFTDMSKSWIWFTGWINCIIFYAIFNRKEKNYHI